MPYQHELEEQIILEIGKKICSGLFKLTMKRNNKSLIWKICALILNSSGTIINGYIYCTKCTNILKHSGNRYSRALYKHECISSYENEGGFDSLNSTDVVDNTVTVSKERVDNLISPIWQIFDLTLTEDGHTLNYLMTCRQCNMALKRNNKTTNQKHKCLAAKVG